MFPCTHAWTQVLPIPCTSSCTLSPKVMVNQSPLLLWIPVERTLSALSLSRSKVSPELWNNPSVYTNTLFTCICFIPLIWLSTYLSIHVWTWMTGVCFLIFHEMYIMIYAVLCQLSGIEEAQAFISCITGTLLMRNDLPCCWKHTVTLLQPQTQEKVLLRNAIHSENV